MDGALFAETLEALASCDVSPAGAPITPDEAASVAEKLRAARLASRCGCGQADCRTYRFRVPAKPKGAVRFNTVRFYATGEHLLHIDSDGDVYELERLDDIVAASRDGL